MSETDYFVERRILRRSRAFWRFFAFAITLVGLGAAIVFGSGRQMLQERSPHIARVEIAGTITGDKKTLETLKRVEESDAKAALIVIDSPGGTVTGSEAIYDAIRKIAAKKPTVAVVDSMAASGGYIAALGTDHIIARQTSIVGSIGVLFQFPNVVKLLDAIGVKVEGVKSSPLKAAPNPVEPVTPEALAALDAVVKDTFGWFKALVKERRGYDDAALAAVSDGRIYTGKQGLGLGLVDGLGDQQTAVDWLVKEKGVQAHLPVRTYKNDSTAERLGLNGSAAFVADWAGASSLATALRRLGPLEQEHTLDGLLAVWHPALENR
jgi:protease-4